MSESPALILRRSEPADAPHLPDIERDAGQRFLEVPGLQWLAADAGIDSAGHLSLIAGGWSWVAALEGRLLGFLQASRHGQDLHIVELSVRRAQQGRGLGGALMAAARQAASEAGLSRLTLTTFRDLAFNEAFYRRLGFVTLALPGARLQAILAEEAGAGLPGRCAMALTLP
ncbi:GNAT family N-acetyltransferase [Bordetella trematum]|uniref:GNAT family N-acetyltransferase n=1 Tax=Bordetella trematum TaxID=123899 RepID=UPI000472CF09|nr:GNAT family N-acetyltransferase [Bordetella trematum]